MQRSPGGSGVLVDEWEYTVEGELLRGSKANMVD